MDEYKEGMKQGGRLLHNCSGRPTIVYVRRMSRIEKVRTSEMEESA